jgi:alpha-2,3 sialyltransferase
MVDKLTSSLKGILVVGNGPSAAAIDFRRLPRNVKFMRMTNFFFEEKYYAGKRVDYYTEYIKRLDNQYFNIRSLAERKEYDIDMQNVYITVMFEANKHFPSVKMATPLIQQNPAVAEFRCFYEYYYGQYLPTGIAAIALAASLGFKQVYLTGFDFFSNDSEHCYKTDPPVFNLAFSELRDTGELYDSATSKENVQQKHPTEMTIQFLELLKKEFSTTQFLSVSESSLITRHVGLAPVMYEDSWYVPEDKPTNYLRDWLPLPDSMPSRKNIKT